MGNLFVLRSGDFGCMLVRSELEIRELHQESQQNNGHALLILLRRD